VAAPRAKARDYISKQVTQKHDFGVQNANSPESMTTNLKRIPIVPGRRIQE